MPDLLASGPAATRERAICHALSHALDNVTVPLAIAEGLASDWTPQHNEPTPAHYVLAVYRGALNAIEPAEILAEHLACMDLSEDILLYLGEVEGALARTDYEAEDLINNGKSDDAIALLTTALTAADKQTGLHLQRCRERAGIRFRRKPDFTELELVEAFGYDPFERGLYSGPPDVLRAILNGEIEADDVSGAKCAKRDRLWYTWFSSGLKFGEIRDKWNAMPKEEKQAVSPDELGGLPKGRTGYDRVKSAVTRLERKLINQPLAK